jgi:hypothetical protein
MWKKLPMAIIAVLLAGLFAAMLGGAFTVIETMYRSIDKPITDSPNF